MTAPAPGWYPDPGSAGTRWWDGAAWTEHVQQPYPVTHPVGTAAGPWGSPLGGAPARPRTWWQANAFSLGVVAFAVLYLALAAVVHVVVFGFLPAILAARAFRAKEPLAVPAAVVAALTVVLAVAELSGAVHL